MSSSRNTANVTRNTSAAASAATPFCKVCRDAGKPESEYTSHFVKDQPGPNGKVVCPTLLNQACRICHKNGHTSSYCSEYNARRGEREEPRREDYRREEPRREDYRREERYIPREEPRREDYRREEPRRDSYDRLREDTERREREIRVRDEAYYREQDRRSKPWLQAVMKRQEPEEDQPRRRRQPYAHPHGPRVRLNLQETALCASKHAVSTVEEEQQHPPAAARPVVDVRKIQLNHASKWGDEDAEEPFTCNPQQMTREFFQNVLMSNLTTSAEHDFIAACDNQNEMPFECGN